MRKISSRYTAFHKKVFPAIWFGFLAVFAIASFVGMQKAAADAIMSPAAAQHLYMSMVRRHAVYGATL